MNETLKRLIDQLDEVHAELPELLQDTGMSDDEHRRLGAAHKNVTEALSAMIFIQRNRK